jgi:hypothetical protein
MNRDQEILAENVIQFLKDCKGMTTYQNILNKYIELNNNRFAVLAGLKDRELIANVGDSSYRLTEKGWDFKGFENERKLQIEKETIQSKIDELTLQKLKFEQFPAKFWWLIIIMTALISILTTLINNQIQKGNNQREIPKSEISSQK